MKTLEKLDTECYNCLETLLKLETRDLKNELEQRGIFWVQLRNWGH